MGGEVFVGVKKRDGSEHLSLRWTNEMPYWLFQPSFYRGGPALKRFLADAHPENKWPNAKTVEAITRSEYGVILIDFPSKSILSRQNYTKPCSPYLSRDSVDDFGKAFLTWYRAGRVTHIADTADIESWPEDGPRPPARQERVDLLLQCCKKGDIPVQGRLSFIPTIDPGFTIDHKSGWKGWAGYTVRDSSRPGSSSSGP